MICLDGLDLVPASVPLVPARKAVEGAVLVEFAEDTELPVQVECGTVMLSVYLSW